MSELKPCPFCGNTNLSCREIPCGGGYKEWIIQCDSHYCQCQPTAHDTYFTKEEAIEAWNRRAERTCHMSKVMKSVDDDNGVTFHDELWNKCSECGGLVPTQPNYCPNCGAKVMSD